MTEQELRDQIAKLEDERADIDDAILTLQEKLARQMAATMVDHYVVKYWLDRKPGRVFDTYEEAHAFAIDVAGENCERQSWYYYGPEGEEWAARIWPIFASGEKVDQRFIMEHFC